MNTKKELKTIQEHFHTLIEERAGKLVKEHNVPLPIISEEIINVEQWISIPGMYGGFSYVLKNKNNSFEMYVESWCRVVGGSGQAHMINKDGYKLKDEGFV